MPILLRKDTIRLFEASIESLHIAASSLGSTRQSNLRESSAAYAAEIGLIGASAEMAMSACLVQAFGTSILELSSGYFKNFPRIVEDFRNLVREANSSSDFLVKSIGDPLSHRKSLLEHVSTFRRLGSIRAGGLHAGRGLTREATVYSANIVSDFLECLALSTRIRPYLSNIPRCLLNNKERTIIVEDLARRLVNQTEKNKNQEMLLASIYLVLPDISQDEPEWISAFDRITVSPKNHDITYLLEVLENAIPASLRRASKLGKGFSVIVDPDDPHAVPIAPQYLRRQFNDLKDRWYADIGIANGRLENGGYLDLPPYETVRHVFEIDLENSDLLNENLKFTAAESWPFIASSLDVNGTTGPFWFLVRYTDDLSQLIGWLNRVKQSARKRLKQKLEIIIPGIRAIQTKKSFEMTNPYFVQILEDIDRAEEKRPDLVKNLERHKGTYRELSEVTINLLEKFAIEGQSSVILFEYLENSKFPIEGLKYWSRVLAEVALDYDDIPMLNRILARQDLGAAHTAAKKAIRAIDFRLYGPPLEDGI